MIFGSSPLRFPTTPVTGAPPLPQAKPPPPPPKKKPMIVNKGAEYIDIDLVEAVLRDNSRTELQWLRELLESGLRIKGNSGRYIKSDRFLQELRKEGGIEC